MASYREQPLQKSDYQNRIPTPNYQKTIQQSFNDEPKNFENQVQIPRKQQSYLETEVYDINNRQYYQRNSKNDGPFSNNPYYNKAALEQVCNRSIITYQEEPNRLQDKNQQNEQEKDNLNLNQQNQNEPISQYYNNEFRDRYQEVKNYYNYQNYQYQSILSPKLYSRENIDQQELQKTTEQKQQQQNYQQKYNLPNEILQENPSFGLIQNYKQKQQQYQNQQNSKQFPYSNQEQQDSIYSNTQCQSQNSSKQQQTKENEYQSQREILQQRQLTTYQKQSPQRCNYEISIQKPQQFHQRLQYLEELKSRLPKDNMFYQQVDQRMPQTEQHYRYELGIMQKSNKNAQQYYTSGQYEHPQNTRYQQQLRHDHKVGSYKNRHDTNQSLNLYHQNQYYYKDQESVNHQYMQRNCLNQKTRTPNRNREDSYERERQYFIHQTSHINTNSQTIHKRK